ncbi:MAG: hypothetical protein AB7G75_34305 [Candidatus Binatia bacterium]
MKTDEHLKQAYHNETRVARFGSSDLNAYDWAITALFYCALHFVDAYLFELRGIDPEGHTARYDRATGRNVPGRNDLVKMHIPVIHADYLKMYSASRRARYDVAYLGLTAATYYQNLKNNEFARVREFFRQQKKW